MPLIYPFRPGRFGGLAPSSATPRLIYPFRPSRFDGQGVGQTVAAPHLIYPFRTGRFGIVLTTVIVPPDTVIPGTDHDIYLDVIGRLEATGAFDEVLAFEDQPPTSADWRVLAIVLPGEETDLDDCDPIVIEEHGAYVVEIRAREQDPERRHRLLSIAAAATRNALNGVSLAGLTLPPKTMMRRKQIPKQRNPEQVVRLAGEWVQLIQGYKGYDDTGDT
jgi:hypothetical protein